MECWGTRGFFYLFVFMQRFERNFQLKSRKAMQDLTLERNLKKTSWIFTLFILTNCNRNCSTTVKYWKNMAF